jgi:hypothetical protein
MMSVDPGARLAVGAPRPDTAVRTNDGRRPRGWASLRPDGSLKCEPKVALLDATLRLVAPVGGRGRRLLVERDALLGWRPALGPAVASLIPIRYRQVKNSDWPAKRSIPATRARRLLRDLLGLLPVAEETQHGVETIGVPADQLLEGGAIADARARAAGHRSGWDAPRPSKVCTPPTNAIPALRFPWPVGPPVRGPGS